MKIKVEQLAGSKVKLDITVTKEKFQEAFDQALVTILKDVEMKGFRKGKVPKDMYLKRYGEGAVLKDAIDIALNESYFEALKTKKIQDVAQPEIDFDYETIGLGKPLHYTATVEVYPTVELGEYFGVVVDKLDEEVTEDDVNQYIERELKAKAELELVENGTLELGQTAVFDFEGSVDGELFEGGKAENYTLEIGSGRFIPGFEPQMIGMKTGEVKTIQVTFPEDYQAENLKGKNADFKITLHEIKKRVLPELNDEFVKELKIDGVETKDAYLVHVNATITADKKEAAANKFTDDVVEAVCQNATVDIPNAMIERRMNQMVGQVEEQAKRYGLNIEQFLQFQGMTVDQYKEAIRVPAEKSVLESIVLDKIAEVEKVGLSDKEMQERYEELGTQYGKTAKEMEAMYPKNQILPYFLNQKTISILKEKANIKE